MDVPKHPFTRLSSLYTKYRDRHWRPLSRGLAEDRKTVIQSRERTCVIRLRSVDAVDFIDFILE
jgi:hypothetical protein